MRKKKWVFPFLAQENEYLVKDLNELKDLPKLYVEIGMGMGDFIIESAKRNPDIFYVGLEKVDICVARAIQKAIDNKLDNFKVLLENADKITELFDENSIDLIYLHFSDPWPKKRNHKRRLTYPSFLKKYEHVLKDDSFLIIKTDNESFYDDSLEYFKESNFTLVDSSRNYFQEGEPMTAYQAKFVNEGKAIYYAKYLLKKV